MSDEVKGSTSRYLIRQCVDGALTSNEFVELEHRLATDPEVRSDYIRFVDLEACLHDELSQHSEVPTDPRRATRFRLWGAFFVVSTAAVVLVSLGTMLRPVNMAVKDNPTPPTPQPPAFYVAAPLQGLPDVAVVTSIDGITDAALRKQLEVGQRLKSGIVKLTEGELQLDFLGGARLLLSGPAEMHLVSNSTATLVNGAVGVRVSHAQKSFVLNAPDVALIDVGSEFGVHVDAQQLTQVQVYSGELEISLLGDDGNTLISQRLGEQGIVNINPQARLFTTLAAPTTPLPRVREADRADLGVTPEYVNLVQRSQPYLYWRFESLEDGIVRDESGNGFDAQIIAGPDDRKAIRVINGMIEFTSSPGPRSLVSTKAIPRFNSGDFSIEFWVMPAELSQAAVLGVLLPSEGSIPMHLNLIELAHNTALVHQPGVIRFLHRQPARQLGGYNLFSQDICIPGTWTHVVATKASDELNLYVNGRLLRTVSGPGTGGRDDLNYNIVLGQLSPSSKTRQFNGLIDEVALYRRVLPASEVSRHYWSVAGQNPAAAAQRPLRRSSFVTMSEIITIDHR